MALVRDKQDQFDCERVYLCQLIQNDDILRQVYPVLKPNLFSNTYSKMLVQWVREYYENTEKAPGHDIKTIFLHKKTSLDDDMISDIATFLKRLSEDNSQGKLKSANYSANTIIDYLKLQNARQFQEYLGQLIESGRTTEIENAIADFKRLEKPQGKAFDILNYANAQAISDAFNQEQERLFRFPGIAGDALGWFLRGDLSVACAPPKTGKSWHLLQAALLAATAGLNVLFINMELTEKQLLRRIWQAMFRFGKNNEEYNLPYFKKSGDKFEVLDEYIVADQAMTDPETIVKLQKKARLYTPSCFKTISYPRGSGVGLREFRADLENLILYEGFQPDVLVVDYADIVEADKKYNDPLEKDNAVFEGLAGMCTKYDMAGLTATQGNRKASEGRKFDIKGLGGSYRKVASCGKYYTIYGTKEERERGLTHIQLQDTRDEHGRYDPVIITQSLNTGQWLVDSRWDKDIFNTSSTESED